MFLQDLLAVEEDAAILDFRCPDTGYLTWPLLRNQFLRALISFLHYRETPLISPPEKGRHRRALAALPKTLWKNAHQWSSMRSEILIMASGAGHFSKNGRSFNRITDYFAMERPESTLTIEGLMDWRVPVQPFNRRTCYYLPWQGAMELRGRLNRKSRHDEHARKLVAFASARAVSLLGIQLSDDQLRLLEVIVASKLAKLPAMQSTYEQLLDRVRPRLILLEQGCYSDLGVFNRVARQAGVRVAEPQHGMITGGHDAYLYGRVLRESTDFQQYLPHDLLVYGSWWGEQTAVPVQKWDIGHPHYVEQTKVLNRDRDKTDILLLSDGFEFGKYLDHGRDLQARIGGRYRVIVRPHPIERARVWAEFGAGANGVAIDKNVDIYSSFVTAFAVVGEVSTGLFEAIGITQHAVLWATPKARFTFPSHPLLECETVEQLAEVLLSRSAADRGVDMSRIWTSDWRGNYARYLERALNDPLPTRCDA